MVVTLPAVLLLLDIWPLRRFSRAAVMEKLPFASLALVMAAITYTVQQHGGAVRSLGVVPLGLRLANAVVSGVAYIGMTVWPARLAVFYPMRARLPAWEVTLAAAVLLGLTWLALAAIRARPYVTVGWFWYLITLLPVVGIVQVGDQARADRYTYIPGIGLALILAWSGAEIWQRWPGARTALAVLGGAAGVAAMALTWWQISYWENSVTLFEHAIQVTDRNAIAHGCLGNAWREQVLYDEAIVEYRKALAIEPHYVASLANLGALLGLKGRTAEAIAPLSEAVQLQPGDAPTRHALGMALAIEGRTNEALAEFDAAIRLRADFAAAHASRGTALASLGRMDEAIAEYTEALRIQPGLADARRNLQKALSIRHVVRE
jgi:protein O-mannosyl-transferase